MKFGDKFNAFLLVEKPDKLAVGCPCVFEHENQFVVNATDSGGFKRIFNKYEFRFEKLPKKKGRPAK